MVRSRTREKMLLKKMDDGGASNDSMTEAVIIRSARMAVDIVNNVCVR